MHALINMTKFSIYRVNSLKLDEINKVLKSKFKIDCDQVKTGYGSQITGNVARKLLAQPKILSNVLKIDFEVVDLFSQILEFCRSPQKYKKNEILDICEKTKDYLSNNQIKQTPTVHKLVMHLPEICEYFWENYSLTVGQLSEEPLESVIRKWRMVRQDRARMINRTLNNFDTINFFWK